MKVCICRNISDREVKAELASSPDKARRHLDVYTACSGGEMFNCGTCAPDFKEMTKDHNRQVLRDKISDTVGVLSGGDAAPAKP